MFIFLCFSLILFMLLKILNLATIPKHFSHFLRYFWVAKNVFKVLLSDKKSLPCYRLRGGLLFPKNRHRFEDARTRISDLQICYKIGSPLISLLTVAQGVTGLWMLLTVAQGVILLRWLFCSLEAMTES